LAVLRAFCTLLDFRNKEFDQALRELLSRFILPRESQQIERVVWEFAQAVYEANTDKYENADELFPLTYATIMLNTDAHNPKQERKMSKQDFITNTQRVCLSISAEYLGKIYDRITSN
jgi:Sec7-like guanine-nucleotide exchange factor